ncbi:hypothetical protein K438DRAFT_1764994 [Mycena galopus ATCC 62051]|nr:hypothetical protein K438DRAFT_1764994 [Mycena galopus ATCC 62051]
MSAELMPSSLEARDGDMVFNGRGTCTRLDTLLLCVLAKLSLRCTYTRLLVPTANNGSGMAAGERTIFVNLATAYGCMIYGTNQAQWRLTMAHSPWLTYPGVRLIEAREGA